MHQARGTPALPTQTLTLARSIERTAVRACAALQTSVPLRARNTPPRLVSAAVTTATVCSPIHPARLHRSTTASTTQPPTGVLVLRRTVLLGLPLYDATVVPLLRPARFQLPESTRSAVRGGPPDRSQERQTPVGQRWECRVWSAHTNHARDRRTARGLVADKHKLGDLRWMRGKGVHAGRAASAPLRHAVQSSWLLLQRLSLERLCSERVVRCTTCRPACGQRLLNGAAIPPTVPLSLCSNSFSSGELGPAWYRPLYLDHHPRCRTSASLGMPSPSG